MTRLIATSALLAFFSGPALAFGGGVDLPNFAFPEKTPAERPQETQPEATASTQQS